MDDTFIFRKGDIVRGLLTGRRYRVLLVDLTHSYVLVAPAEFGLYLPSRPSWQSCYVLELVK